MQRNSHGIDMVDQFMITRFAGGEAAVSRLREGSRPECGRTVALAAANYRSPINRINGELHEKSVIALERVSAAP